MTQSERPKRAHPFEWPTYLVAVFCYAVWGMATAFHETIGIAAACVIAALATTLHSSLQHEALHGHPTRLAWINELLVFPALGVFVPYRRFKSLHLRHHRDSRLTDPYDDPESFYLTEADHTALPWIARFVLRINNTLAGRVVMGPAIALSCFYRREIGFLIGGDRAVLLAWFLHVVGVGLAFSWLVGVCGFSPFVYVALVAYPGYALLMIRTFAEHRAREAEGERTVIVDASPFFAFLFLNNNLHFVHHAYPRAAWYELPAIHRDNRARMLAENDGYRFSGYREIFRKYAFTPKEPVIHPARRESLKS